MAASLGDSWHDSIFVDILVLVLENISGGKIQIIILMRGAFVALGERWHGSFVVKQNVKRSTLPVSAPISAPSFCLCFNCLNYFLDIKFLLSFGHHVVHQLNLEIINADPITKCAFLVK